MRSAEAGAATVGRSSVEAADRMLAPGHRTTAHLSAVVPTLDDERALRSTIEWLARVDD